MEFIYVVQASWVQSALRAELRAQKCVFGSGDRDGEQKRNSLDALLSIIIQKIKGLLYLVIPNIYDFRLVGHYGDILSYRVNAGVYKL